MNPNKLHQLAACLLASLSLQGCMVVSAVDLAATTVLTAGKIVVKGTGALIEAAIPDQDENHQADKAGK